MLHFLLNYAILMWFYVKHIQAHHILSDNFRFKNREYLKFSTLCYTLFLYLLYKVASQISWKRDKTCATGRDCLPCSLISTTTAYSNITRFERHLASHFCSSVVHYNFSCNLYSCLLV